MLEPLHFLRWFFCFLFFRCNWLIKINLVITMPPNIQRKSLHLTQVESVCWWNKNSRKLKEEINKTCSLRVLLELVLSESNALKFFLYAFPSVWMHVYDCNAWYIITAQLPKMFLKSLEIKASSLYKFVQYIICEREKGKRIIKTRLKFTLKGTMFRINQFAERWLLCSWEKSSMMSIPPDKHVHNEEDEPSSLQMPVGLDVLWVIT